MPQLSRVLMESDLKRTGTPTSSLDLGPYLEMVEQILAEGGVGGQVELGPGESSRTEKGRLTRAAKQRGRTLVWRKAQDGHLRFVLAEPGSPAPGSRKRRVPAPPPPAPAPKRGGRRTRA